jgi:hypothetical protein
MTIADPETYQRHRHRHDRSSTRTAWTEILLTMLLFGSIGAITWAVRGTRGWGGIDGTILPGMTWALLWYYVCGRKGIDARGIALWLGLGIALGGELGYGQYVSWIRGMFNVGDEIIDIAPWVGWLGFIVAGIGWGAPGGIALGWALGGKTSLNGWLVRLMIPVGIALFLRMFIQAYPGLFFPHWDPVRYAVRSDGIDPAVAAI